MADPECAADSIETYPVAEKLENRNDVGMSDSVCSDDCVSIAEDVTDIDGETVTPIESVSTVCDGDIVSTTTELASNVDDMIVGKVEYCTDFVGVAVISIPVDIILVTKLSDVADIGGVVTMTTDSVENSLIDCMSEMIVFDSAAVKMPEINGVVSA